jgi:hypothetical protein
MRGIRIGCRFLGYLEEGKRRQRFLCGSFSEQAMTTTSYYLRTLMQVADARLSNVTLLVEFERSFKLRQFIGRNIEYRRFGEKNAKVCVTQAVTCREADRTGNPLLSEYSKLLNNSSFGFSLINRSRYNKTRLVSGGQYEKKFRSSRFAAGTAVGRPGPREVLILFPISLPVSGKAERFRTR